MEFEELTIAEHLIKRLAECGIKHISGVPGDYQLNFLDYVENSDLVEWVGSCNELNAAYTADGYGRVHGMGAILTTNGPGELSAINGIAGAYAENVAVVHIVGMPPLKAQERHLPLHHTLASGNYDEFSNMQKYITCDAAIIQTATAVEEIDSILLKCYLTQKPVLISIAYDLFEAKIQSPITPLKLELPQTDAKILHKILSETKIALNAAKHPLVIVDAGVRNHGLVNAVRSFIEAANLPFVATSAALGLISECHPNFIGRYFGKLTNSTLLEFIENSDLLIWGGRFDTDINSWAFTTSHDLTKMLVVHFNQVQLGATNRLTVNGLEFLNSLAQEVKPRELLKPNPPIKKISQDTSLTHKTFWQIIEQLLPANTNIILEQGSSYFGIMGCNLPKNTTVISQPLWGSIGWSVGCTLGILHANVKPNTYLFVGDGSFQLSGNEVAEMLKNEYAPVIFLLNNAGYTVERAIHGAMRNYNNISTWDYSKFVKSFSGNLKTWQIRTLTDMKNLGNELAANKDKLRFVEVFLAQDDLPDIMRKLFSGKNWVV